MRFGQLHRAGPSARHQFFEIDFLQPIAAVRIERLDRAQRQQRTETERDIRRAPDFGAGGVDRERQALSAEILRPRDGIPARRRPAPVGIGPAGRGCHAAALQLCAVFVAGAVERRQHLGCEPASLLQHGRRNLGIIVAVVAGLDRGLEFRAMVESKEHVADRCSIGHDGVSLQWPDGEGVLPCYQL